MAFMGVRDVLTRPLYRLYEDRLLADLDRTGLPRHIGVIHDGNRRYAMSEGLPDVKDGYRAGMDKFIEFLNWTDELRIEAVTCWLLSKENLGRPNAELDALYEVLIELFDKIPDAIAHHDAKVSFIGSLDLLPGPLVESAKNLEERCPTGERRITIALGYGGRQEITDAVKDLVARLADEGLDAAELSEKIDDAGIAGHLYTADLPDPDLVVRTSGEARLSGFLLWQSAYAEYSFVDVYWPAFRRVDFLRVLRDFTKRDRRFGQ